MGRGSSIYEIPVVLNTDEPIIPNTKILDQDVIFEPGEFNPGKGAAIRLSLCLAPGSDFEISITLDGTAPAMKLNGDNDFVTKDGGYYRFDIAVDDTSLFNFSINQSLVQSAIKHIKLQKILFGA